MVQTIVDSTQQVIVVKEEIGRQGNGLRENDTAIINCLETKASRRGVAYKI